MTWFGRAKPKPPPPASSTPDYTIETVRNHLETIGMLRPTVRSAAMKVALTLIAWNGEGYLTRQSSNGTPSGAQIVKLCKQLETAERVIAEFKEIEKLQPPNADELLAQGLEGVQTFAFRLAGISTDKTASSPPSRTAYVVDTQILSME